MHKVFITVIVILFLVPMITVAQEKAIDAKTDGAPESGNETAEKSVDRSQESTASPETTDTPKYQFKAMISPNITLTYGPDVYFEYFMKPQISIGFNYFSGSQTEDTGDKKTTFSMTITRLYGHYHLQPVGNDSIVSGAGLMTSDITLERTNSFSGKKESVTGSASGPAFEVIYSLFWEKYILDFGYEVWMLGTIEMELDDGEKVSFPVGSIGGLLLRIGAAF